MPVKDCGLLSIYDSYMLALKIKVYKRVIGRYNIKKHHESEKAPRTSAALSSAIMCLCSEWQIAVLLTSCFGRVVWRCTRVKLTVGLVSSGSWPSREINKHTPPIPALAAALGSVRLQLSDRGVRVETELLMTPSRHNIRLWSLSSAMMQIHWECALIFPSCQDHSAAPNPFPVSPN